jgi:hypothetical protein
MGASPYWYFDNVAEGRHARPASIRQLERLVPIKRASAFMASTTPGALSIMNRSSLDALAARHRLSADQVDKALSALHARPTRAEIVLFSARVLRLAGALSAAAGLVFLVAANWAAVTIFARFAIVEAALVIAGALALWRPPPHAVGRYALLCAFIATGALLALFGQTYQTGADVYELFVSWALLGFVFVLAARSSVASAAWLLVANVGLLLFCGLRPESGLFWLFFSDWGLALLLVPLVVNALLWLMSTAIEASRWTAYAPPWLGRVALAFAVASGTWAGMAAILGIGPRRDELVGEGLVLLAALVMLAGIAALAVRRRSDVFPLALIAGSGIALSSTAIVQLGDLDPVGVTFVLAAWLVASSTLCGSLLMKLVRAWHDEEALA